MRIEDDLKLDYSDVLIRPKRSTLSSRKEVSLTRSYQFRNARTKTGEPVSYEGIPVIAANMDGVGTLSMAKALGSHGMFTALNKFVVTEDLKEAIRSGLQQNNFAVSIGSSEKEVEAFAALYEEIPEIQFLCMDVANGYQESFGERIEDVRKRFPEIVIMAGNVVTGDMATELLLRGADVIKVGIGPGSVCTTRVKTGVGYPQLSAVIECADAAHGLGGHIIADGGCVCPGDVAKAFGGGADFVMLGGMLAGYDEGEGVVDEDGHIVFYGMSSDTANKKHFGGLKNYRASEGRTIKMKYRGSVESAVQDILGGVRSTCTYVGAKNLKQLSKCTTFIRVNNTHNRVFEQKEF